MVYSINYCVTIWAGFYYSIEQMIIYQGVLQLVFVTLFWANFCCLFCVEIGEPFLFLN
jgi:hypothetical protein